MRKLILEPLHKEHLVVKISATDLEEPFKWKTSELKEEENMERGDILHSVLLNSLLCREKAKYVFMFYASDLNDKQRDWLRKCLKLSEGLPELLIVEQKRRLQIEYGKYLIILSSKFDGLYIDDGKVNIIDVKTAAHKWEKEDAENKAQLKLYAFINEVKDIAWRIFTKSVNPELQIIPFELDLQKNRNEVILRLMNHMEDKYGYVGSIDKHLFM